MSHSIEKHFAQLRRWIDLESEAERQRMADRRRRRSAADAERRGETLLDLVILDHDTGLGGRFLITFGKRNRTLPLPWNRLRVGSPVMLSPDGDLDGDTLSGVVSSKSPQSIQIAFEDWPDGHLFRVDLSADEVTRGRMLSAMQQALHARGRIAQLREILMNERAPNFRAARTQPAPHLNDSQQAAVEFALSAQDLAIIHGPPGTGKTTTVVELIRQAVASGMTVLATAPSNTAVDNLLERIAPLGIQVLRIGHPARVHPLLQSLTLDALAEADPAMKLVKDLMKEAEKIARKADKQTRAKPVPGYRQELRREIKRLRDDARHLEKQIISSLLDRAEVICATTTFDPDVLGDREFELGVIDEACQSTEPGCWPVVLRSDRLILAGDHCQLPPTVLSTQAANEGFAISLMERLVKTYGDTVTRRLTVQYRMHQQIMEFSSREFYGDELLCHPSVASHLLSDLAGMKQDEWTETPLKFIDTAGAGWEEEQEPDSESRRNPQEAKLVLRILNQLLADGLPPEDIAVIAPYAAQARLLRESSEHRLVEIDTVDGFQGREKEAVIISLVRSNATGEVGFLADTRRMNVALTRAKRKLIIIGDSATLSSHPFYTRLISYMESQNAYATVWDGYMEASME